MEGKSVGTMEPERIFLPRFSLGVTELFEKLINLFRRFIDFEDPFFYTLVAIYVLFTHFFDVFDKIPYLQVSGPPGSGKTLLGDIFLGLSYNAFNSSEISDAALFRKISEKGGKVTMVVDEADDLSGSTRGSLLLRILRSGYRRNGCVTRFIGGTAKQFKTFCPKILLNEGGIHDPALASRCIPIQMNKSTRSLERLRIPEVGEEFEAFKEVKALIDSFSKNYRNLVTDWYLAFRGVDGIVGRDDEVWGPIFIFADLLSVLTNTPSMKEDMLSLGKKILLQRRKTQLIGNRKAQILVGTQAYIEQAQPLEIDNHRLYVGEDMCQFIKEAFSISDLKVETVSRALNQFNVIREVRRVTHPDWKINTKGSEIKVQKSCYELDKERLSRLVSQY